MIETMAIISVCATIALFGMLIGLIIGQCNIWRYLRKKKIVRIDDWEYSARQAK